MRAQNIYDRDGNSYRYCRAIKEAERVRERAASDKKWDKIYDKIMVSKPKSDDIPPKIIND